jgi:hypothetical protein
MEEEEIKTEEGDVMDAVKPAAKQQKTSEEWKKGAEKVAAKETVPTLHNVT